MVSLACIENTGVAPSGTVRLLDIREQGVTGLVRVSWRIWPGPDLADLATREQQYCCCLLPFIRSDIALSKTRPIYIYNLEVVWNITITGTILMSPQAPNEEKARSMLYRFCEAQVAELGLGRYLKLLGRC